MSTWENGPPITSSWEEQFDEQTQQTVYYNKKSGDYSIHVPYGFQVILNK